MAKKSNPIFKFLLILTSLLLVTHIYMAIKLTILFDNNLLRNILVLSVLSLMFPASLLFERYKINLFTKLFYFLGSAWAGISLIMFLIFAIHDVISIPLLLFGLNFYTPFQGTMLLLATTVLSIMSLANGFILRTRKEIIRSGKISEPLKLIHISDVHIGIIYTKDRLRRIVNRLNKEKPDYVFITGDLLDATGIIDEDTLSPLKDLKANHGIFYCTGNHEIYFGLERAVDLVRKQNIIVVRNEVMQTPHLQIVGVDSPEEESRNKIPELKQLDSDLKKDKYSVLLYHIPHGLKDFKRSRIDLMLSGHTHEGQVYPFKYITKMMFQYSFGLHRLGSKHIHISSGAGTWGPPMRLGTKNEIVEIVLRPLHH